MNTMNGNKCKGCENKVYPRGAEWCRECRERMSDYSERITSTIMPERLTRLFADLMFEVHADKTVARLEARIAALENKAGSSSTGRAADCGSADGGSSPPTPTTYTLPAAAVEELRMLVSDVERWSAKGIRQILMGALEAASLEK